MNPATLTDSELLTAYASECGMAAAFYADGIDTTEIDARVDLLVAEMQRRGLA